ncbi:MULTISPECIES: DUF423 domain-containing protein [Staphylococcus]|nr:MULTISPECIES: DUF423 domain-containing protein [Staphylococcus]AMY06792.1 hypothetical protein A4G25_06505 [Staphylococcus condimenti]APR62115.1 hypothetical protein BTZ13_11530 [Staphylococcus condimenti]MDK8645649.1 DUF423 domain-containing protein [Staphylococcus condimenti]OFO99455.1 hypothetical protein HMPREF3007_05925 [Staphylococcus sp. HMSC065E08]QQS84072.1 DUF423 domain-containing protein [Staphylococcus condimenti]
MKTFLALGAGAAALSVATGAFGAHALEGKLSEHYLDVWQKATQYEMYHSLGLIGIGILSGTTKMNLKAAGWMMFGGIVIFSGSLYVLSLTQIKPLGAITPIGGVLFIASWVTLLVQALKIKK